MANSPISEDIVNAAQQAWCDGLVHIGAVDKSGGDVRSAAGESELFFCATTPLMLRPCGHLARLDLRGDGVMSPFGPSRHLRRRMTAVANGAKRP
jgi:hypothetical protein